MKSVSSDCNATEGQRERPDASSTAGGIPSDAMQQNASAHDPTLAPPQVVSRILLASLDFYRKWLSPAIHSLSPGGCRYLPTCSEYASIAIATHGPLRGMALAIWRLLRCHPFARGGLDPVPPASTSRHFLRKPLP